MADQESEAREALGAAAAALAARTQLDELAVDVLLAPGMGVAAGERLTAFVDGGSLQRGQAAIERLRTLLDRGLEEQAS